MLRTGDPVNLGERRHLIVKLADVAAHNVRLRENRCPRATSHRRPNVRSVRRVLQTGAALTSTVIHYEDAVYEIHTAQNRQYLLTDDDRVCAYFESHRKGTVSSSLLPRAVSNPSRRRSILARA